MTTFHKVIEVIWMCAFAAMSVGAAVWLWQTVL